MALYSKKQLAYERSKGLKLSDEENESGVDCPDSIYPNDAYREGQKLIYKNDNGYIIVISTGLQGSDDFYGKVIETTNPSVEVGEHSVFGRGFYSPIN